LPDLKTISMVEVSIDRENNMMNIIFNGFLDVSKIETLYGELLGSRITKDNIVVIIRDVDNIDLSFLQLLHAFLLKLKRDNKTFSFQWDVEPEYFKLVEESGFIADFNKISNK
jgi:anti-anti-sigma regulatory factor